MTTRGLPEKVSEETRRRNPHLYPPTHTGPPKTFSDIPTKAQATKYHAQRTTVQRAAETRAFDSKAEADRYLELQALQAAGKISHLECQPQYHLSDAQIGYKADFQYREDGRTIAEDVKGVMTERFGIITKLWKHYGPHPLRITTRKSGAFVTKREIVPNNKLNFGESSSRKVPATGSSGMEKTHD